MQQQKPAIDQTGADQGPAASEARWLDEAQQRIRYHFRHSQLLLTALTHSSGAAHALASNERLEFLGDSILGLVACEYLFRHFPESQEGELTRIKSVAVSRQTCARLAGQLGLEHVLILGKGMTHHGGPPPPSALANAFESVVGAIYLDGGMSAARDFILPLLEPEIRDAHLGGVGVNHKSQLQQLAQRRYGATPTYQILDEKGPDHQKCFKVVARIASQPYTPAWGMTKKDAEQRAALNALSEILGQPIPFATD